MNVMAKIRKDTRCALIKNRAHRKTSVAVLERKLSDAVKGEDFDTAYALTAGIEALKSYGRAHGTTER